MIESGAQIRVADRRDDEAIWAILEPIIRSGETYALPRDMPRAAALDYWFARGHAVHVLETEGAVLATYYLRANQAGGGDHVANCGYMVGRSAEGRGAARAMCLHSLRAAARAGFRAMQFNFVVGSNERAVRLWENLGFAVVGRLPLAFRHPSLGFVDALVMFRALDNDDAKGGA